MGLVLIIFCEWFSSVPFAEESYIEAMCVLTLAAGT